MYTINPFAELASSIPPVVMQTFLIVMVLFVVGGTLFDVIHKGSARYFFDNFRKSREQGSKVNFSSKLRIAVHTLLSDVLTSSELIGWKRRTAHLLGMYGFILNVVATFMMVMFYTASDIVTPAIWPKIWVIGAIMVCV